jgi:hypothetical protein
MQIEDNFIINKKDTNVKASRKHKEHIYTLVSLA